MDRCSSIPSADDTFHSFDAQGPPLGLLPRLTYGGPELLKFDSGDILVLVTDGFIEYNNGAGEEFGSCPGAGRRPREPAKAARGDHRSNCAPPLEHSPGASGSWTISRL